MLRENERKELLKKADDAWIEFGRWTNEVVAPRFYKEKKGRKMEYLNPWKDMKERIAAEEKTTALYEEWLHLFQHYIAQTGKRPVLPVLYKKIETPNGDRMVRTSLPAPH
jgi:hypothetical protein